MNANTADSGDDTGVATFGIEDLSERVNLWFVDPWPANKSLAEYHLVFFEDPQHEDPIVLQCRRAIPVPEGTGMAPYDDFATTQLNDSTVQIGRAALVMPDLTDLAEDSVRMVPESMQNTIVRERAINDNGFLDHLIKNWEQAQPDT